MSILFSPSGALNVAADSSELPETAGQNSVSSGAMVRCKNLRLNEPGKAKTRDGSTKLNASAINTEIWWIEEQAGTRYTFAGTVIYSNESSIATGLTSAQWVAIKYNAYNDLQLNIFALNGTDLKRIQNGVVREWGIEPPTVAPILSQGGGSGLTGVYNAKYTYLRKSGDTVIAESDPSPEGDEIELSGGSLGVEFEAPTDPQVTHIRLYRTWADGELYYYDQDILANVNYIYGRAYDWEDVETDVDGTIVAYEYGYTFDWESTDTYFSGTGYQFSTADSTHSTENAYSWEFIYNLDSMSISVSSSELVESPNGYYLGYPFSHATATVTVTATDTLGTVTYSWVKTSGDAITVASPSSAATAFIADGMTFLEARTAYFRCTVTDLYLTRTVDVYVSIFDLPVP